MLDIPAPVCGKPGTGDITELKVPGHERRKGNNDKWGKRKHGKNIPELCSAGKPAIVDQDKKHEYDCSDVR